MNDGMTADGMPAVAQQTDVPKFWATAKHGWVLTVILALFILILPFKDIIWVLIKAPELLEQLSSASPFWQAVVKNGLTDNIGTVLETSLPFAMLIGGCILLGYALVSSYFVTYRALGANGGFNTGQQPSGIIMRNIVLKSLLINLPILYWAFYLFIGLPQLVKMPIASLSTGSIAALVAACVAMVIIAILATHIGLTMTRILFRYMARAQ